MKLTPAVLTVMMLAGCPSPDPTQGLVTVPPDQLLDYNTFVCTVMPVLVRRCSYLGCHGDPNHALRVYSPGKLRQLPTTTRRDRDAALTPDEVELNFESASGVVYLSSPADRNPPNWQKVLLLGKPLKASNGGAEHHGVGIFPTYPLTDQTQDPEFTALAQWVAGAKMPANSLTSDCAQLMSLLKLTPR